jgi:Icc-related predicted phosphoesterase
MSNKHMTKILCAGDPRGDAAALESVLAKGGDTFDAVALVGDLGGPSANYRSVLGTLGSVGRPAYWVPGRHDAPIGEYLEEAYNVETVFPLLRGVHGTLAIAPGHVLFAGLGGEISDDPRTPRDEVEALSYPRWEVEYRLKVLRELDEHETVLLFGTTPLHKGEHTGESEIVAELIATYRARLAVCAGPPASQVLGRSLVVSPGSVTEGQYAIADLQARAVDLKVLAAA